MAVAVSDELYGSRDGATLFQATSFEGALLQIAIAHDAASLLKDETSAEPSEAHLLWGKVNRSLFSVLRFLEDKGGMPREIVGADRLMGRHMDPWGAIERALAGDFRSLNDVADSPSSAGIDQRLMPGNLVAPPKAEAGRVLDLVSEWRRAEDLLNSTPGDLPEGNPISVQQQQIESEIVGGEVPASSFEEAVDGLALARDEIAQTLCIGERPSAAAVHERDPGAGLAVALIDRAMKFLEAKPCLKEAAI
jgi:hypothetical protein